MFEDLRCLTWEVSGQWIVAVFQGEELLARDAACELPAACRWAALVRSELGLMGLDGLEPPPLPTVRQRVGTSLSRTALRARPH